jgi:hypothetical protein
MPVAAPLCPQFLLGDGSPSRLRMLFRDRQLEKCRDRQVSTVDRLPKNCQRVCSNGGQTPLGV